MLTGWVARGVVLGAAVTLSGTLMPHVGEVVAPAYERLAAPSTPAAAPALRRLAADGLRVPVPGDWVSTPPPRDDVALLLSSPKGDASLAVLRTELPRRPTRRELAGGYREGGYAVLAVDTVATPAGPATRVQARRGETAVTALVLADDEQVLSLVVAVPAERAERAAELAAWTAGLLRRS